MHWIALKFSINVPIGRICNNTFEPRQNIAVPVCSLTELYTPRLVIMGTVKNATVFFKSEFPQDPTPDHPTRAFLFACSPRVLPQSKDMHIGLRLFGDWP